MKRFNYKWFLGVIACFIASGALAIWVCSYTTSRLTSATSHTGSASTSKAFEHFVGFENGMIGSMEDITSISHNKTISDNKAEIEVLENLPDIVIGVNENDSAQTGSDINTLGFDTGDYYTQEPYRNVPLIYQTDYPDIHYGEHGTIKTHGCGITSIAMVANYLTGTMDYMPDTLAELFGEYNEPSGSSWALFVDSAEILGIDAPYQCMNWNVAKSALEDGAVIIACVNEKSDFTETGHYIVMKGIAEVDGVIRIYINDPNYGNYTKTHLQDGFNNGFTEDYFEQEKCSAFWIYNWDEIYGIINMAAKESRAAIETLTAAQITVEEKLVLVQEKLAVKEAADAVVAAAQADVEAAREASDGTKEKTDAFNKEIKELAEAKKAAKNADLDLRNANIELEKATGAAEKAAKKAESAAQHLEDVRKAQLMLGGLN